MCQNVPSGRPSGHSHAPQWSDYLECYAYYLANGTRYSRFYENQVWLAGDGSSGFRIRGEYDDPSYRYYYGAGSLMLDHNQVWTNSGSGSVAYNLNPWVETPNGSQ